MFIIFPALLFFLYLPFIFFLLVLYLLSNKSKYFSNINSYASPPMFLIIFSLVRNLFNICFCFFFLNENASSHGEIP